MPQKIKKKKSLKKSKNTKKLVIYIVVSLALCMCIGGIFLINHLRTNAKFNITSVIVEGQEKYTQDEIVAASEIELGSNLFKLSENKTEKKIVALPYVESVEVIKQYPSVVKINVVERSGRYVAYANDSGQYVKIDSGGYILEAIDVSDISENMIFFGINFEDVIEPGQKITDTELNKISTYEKIKKIYEETDIEQRITSVEFKKSNVILSLNDKLNVILVDNSELEYKISLLKTLLKELDGKTGVLNMTLDNPTYAAI